MADRKYSEIKKELDEILDWFESDSVEIDEAMKKHAQAEKLLEELEKYLKRAESKIKATE